MADNHSKEVRRYNMSRIQLLVSKIVYNKQRDAENTHLLELEG